MRWRSSTCATSPAKAPRSLACPERTHGRRHRADDRLRRARCRCSRPTSPSSTTDRSRLGRRATATTSSRRAGRRTVASRKVPDRPHRPRHRRCAPRLSESAGTIGAGKPYRAPTPIADRHRCLDDLITQVECSTIEDWDRARPPRRARRRDPPTPGTLAPRTPRPGRGAGSSTRSTKAASTKPRRSGRRLRAHRSPDRRLDAHVPRGATPSSSRPEPPPTPASPRSPTSRSQFAATGSSSSRVVMRAADGHEMVFLNIGEVDETGRACSTTSFDEDVARPKPKAQLDERYLAGEGTPHARLIQPALRAMKPTHQQLDAMALTISPDFAFVDHRPMGFGEGDGERFLDAGRTNEELITEHSDVIRTFFVSGNTLLGVRDGRGVTTRESSTGTSAALSPPSTGAGLLGRTEIIAEGKLPGRAHPPRRAGRARNPPTAATRVPRTTRPGQRSRMLELFNAGRFEEAEQLLTEDFVRVDHRTVVSMPTSYGRDAFVQSSRLPRGRLHRHDDGADRGPWRSTRAVAGHDARRRRSRDGLPQHRRGRRDRPSVQHHELRRGRARRRLQAELDDRYLAGEGTPHADPASRSGASAAAPCGAECDAVALRALSPDFVVVDIGLSVRGGRRDYLVTGSSQDERRSSGRGRHPRQHAVHVLRRRHPHGRQRGGHRREGGTVHAGPSACCSASTRPTVSATSSGSTSRTGNAALARLDELGAAEPADLRHARAENAATRFAIRYCETWSPDRLDQLDALVAPDIVRVDHRSIVAAPETVGHEAFLGSSRAFAEVGYTSLTFEPIVVRGERLCLG